MNTSTAMRVTVTTFILVTTQFAPAMAQREFSVRETHGMRQIQGWEDELVRGNPNLSHFHWNPMYSTNHVYRRMSEPTAPLAVPPGPHYIKPTHEQTAFVKRPSIKPIHLPMATPTSRSTYTRPSQLPLPSSRNLDGSLKPNPQVSGKLAFHDVGGLLKHANQPADRAVRGHLLNRNTSISLSAANANGKLIARRAEAALANPGVLSYNSADTHGRLLRQNDSSSRQVYAELYKR